MSQRMGSVDPGLALVLGAALLSTAAVVAACADADKRRVIGDTCIKDDECQAGRCDEFVCKAKDPREPEDECSHPLDCRSESCVMRLEDDRWRARCGPGIRPRGAECTDDLQCARDRDPRGGEPVAQAQCIGGVCGGAVDAGATDAGADHAVSDAVVPLPRTWVTIPAGSFMMGSPWDDLCSGTHADQHEVTLTRSFEIRSSEVSQGEFEGLMGYNPSWFGPNGGGADCGGDCPVETVSWHEAVAYCNALSVQATLTPCYACSGSGASVTCSVAPAFAEANIYTCPGYRLPTEGEWEYAYRAGTQTAYYNGDNDPAACRSCKSDTNLEPIAWYCSNSGSKTHPVGQKQANAWRLYDMGGNVWEWCHDWYATWYNTAPVTDPWGTASGSSRVLRGGGSYDYAGYLHAARRHRGSPTARYSHYGFRPARGLQ